MMLFTDNQTKRILKKMSELHTTIESMREESDRKVLAAAMAKEITSLMLDGEHADLSVQVAQ